MKGIVLDRSMPGSISYREVEEDALQANQVRVMLKAAALNHRDEWCRQGLYPNLRDGVVLGSDGAGVILEVGAAVKHRRIGDEVIINPALFWGQDPKAQSSDFQIIGMPSHGTFAESISIDEDRLHPKPLHLSWEEAAALPLAGLTAYRALVTQGKLQRGETVLITGFGGGVAQFATQLALALGGNVFVSSSSPTKIQLAKTIGVLGGYSYKDVAWTEVALADSGGFDLIIDGASGDGLNDLFRLTKPGGRLVIYGATQGNCHMLEARRIFWNQLQLLGSTMGTDADFQEMLNLVNHFQIHPILDQIVELKDAEEAFDRMREGKQMGKLVLIP